MFSDRKDMFIRKDMFYFLANSLYLANSFKLFIVLTIVAIITSNKWQKSFKMVFCLEIFNKLSEFQKLDESGQQTKLDEISH